MSETAKLDEHGRPIYPRRVRLTLRTADGRDCLPIDLPLDSTGAVDWFEAEGLNPGAVHVVEVSDFPVR